MRNRGYLHEEKKTKSVNKRFFIKKKNKVSNFDDQFEEVVFLHEMKEEKEWSRKLAIYLMREERELVKQ